MQARRQQVFRRRLANAAAGIVLLLVGGAGGWLARGDLPEPASLSLLGLAVAGIATRRRRRIA